MINMLIEVFTSKWKDTSCLPSATSCFPLSWTISCNLGQLIIFAGWMPIYAYLYIFISLSIVYSMYLSLILYFYNIIIMCFGCNLFHIKIVSKDLKTSVFLMFQGQLSMQIVIHFTINIITYFAKENICRYSDLYDKTFKSERIRRVTVFNL